MLFTLALRNLTRQRTRTAITLTAIASGVAALIVAGGFIADLFIQFGEAIIHSQTGHVQVFRQEFLEKGTRQPERYLIDEPETLAGQLKARPEVDDVSSRLNFSGLLTNGRRDLAILGEGIEPDKEARLGTFLRITEGRQLSDADVYGILAGQGVAHTLGLKPGDRVTLLMQSARGALNSVDFELVGVFQSFSKEYDARAIRISLGAAQELLGTSGANLLVVNLHRTEDTNEFAEYVNDLLRNSPNDSRTWRQLSDFYDRSVELYDRQFGVLEFIILLMVLLSVVNSVNMSAFERQSEFGTLQALGNRPADVFRLLLVENAVLGVAGAALGVVAGIFLALGLSAIGIPMPPPPNSNLGYVAAIRIVPANVASAFMTGMLATLLAAIFPARRIARTPIVEALRQGV